MAQQHPMMPVQHQGYPPQHMQPQNMHMIQQQQYQYPPQRMPGTGQHHVGPGGALQPMAGQPHMLTPQGMPPQAQQVSHLFLVQFELKLPFFSLFRSRLRPKSEKVEEKSKRRSRLKLRRRLPLLRSNRGKL